VDVDRHDLVDIGQRQFGHWLSVPAAWFWDLRK
jgi:hypothetical protein